MRGAFERRFREAKLIGVMGYRNRENEEYASEASKRSNSSV